MKQKSRKIKTKKILAFLILISVMLAGQQGMTVSLAGGDGEEGTVKVTAYDEGDSSDYDAISYGEYLEIYKDMPDGEDEYVIPAEDYSGVYGMQAEALRDYEGDHGVSILTDEQGTTQWQADVKKAGFYNLSILYYPIEGKSADIQRTVLIDGELPFSEASRIEFSRCWGDELEEIRTDSAGNDIQQRQVEIPVWSVEAAKDAKGYHTDPFAFYLSEGLHTISLVSRREPLLIRELRLTPPEEILDYAAVYKQYEENGYRETDGEPVVIEAENAKYKSSPMLYGFADHSSPAITPYDAAKTKVNAIGGNSWNEAGDWIEWEVRVPESGLYKLGVNVRQNFVRGVPVKRKLTIDGRVPFTEMKEVDFFYQSGYNVVEIGGEEPCLFYLEEGTHTIRMEAVLGNLSAYIEEVDAIVRDLNEIYREIVMITGSAPDSYRDYQLGRKMPGLSEAFTEQSGRLQAVIDGLKSVVEDSGDRAAALETMVQQLDKFAYDVEKVIPGLNDFKSNIVGLSTWVLRMNEVPLQLDRLYLIPAGADAPKTDNSAWAKICHEVKSLYYSFFIDYNSLGDAGGAQVKESITVWIISGRDQANILKRLIDDKFTPETGIGVELMLVPAESLQQATLSGQGPDVAMQVENNLPMNFAMRGAVADLTGFADFGEVTGRFNDSAMVPYRFDGKCYALPETQTFPMMFYRKDILEELDLEVPETWDDFKACISVLSRNNLKAGLMSLMTNATSAGNTVLADQNILSAFGMFLYQAGGEFYTEDGRASALDSDEAVSAFKEWTRYYSDYTLEREYDFANRFRSGEMPIGIADYSMYNTLQVFAPEISGLWDFTEVPGTVKEDGTVDHTVPSTGKAAIIMEQSGNKEAAWEFLKWWTSTEAQTDFGREMEGVMGAAARYPTANVEALALLPLPLKDYNNIMSQFENVKGIPEIPGSYYTGRNVTNAFYKVVVSEAMGPREGLMEYVRYINDEITSKREEFGLD